MVVGVPQALQAVLADNDVRIHSSCGLWAVSMSFKGEKEALLCPFGPEQGYVLCAKRGLGVALTHNVMY